MDQVSINLKWDTVRAAEMLAKSPDIVVDELVNALTEGSMLAEREIKEHTPTSGAGTLRDSIGALPVNISGAALRAEVATALSYALPVEEGSKPHWAPLEPLVEWVQRRLGKQGDEAQEIARRVQFKIARKGTPAFHMFADGADAVAGQFEAMLDRALGRAAKRMGAA